MTAGATGACAIASTGAASSVSGTFHWKASSCPLTGDTASEASLLAQAIDAGQSNPSHLERLAFLQRQTSAGGRAAVWVAPSGSFGNFAASPSFQVLALTDITTPQTTSFE